MDGLNEIPILDKFTHHEDSVLACQLLSEGRCFKSLSKLFKPCLRSKQFKVLMIKKALESGNLHLVMWASVFVEKVDLAIDLVIFAGLNISKVLSWFQQTFGEDSAITKLMSFDPVDQRQRMREYPIISMTQEVLDQNDILFKDVDREGLNMISFV